VNKGVQAGGVGEYVGGVFKDNIDKKNDTHTHLLTYADVVSVLAICNQTCYAISMK
jgi:hypothetical protein